MRPSNHWNVRTRLTMAFLAVAVIPLVVFVIALREFGAITLVAFVIALVIASTSGIIIARTISEPLRGLAAAAIAIADGDPHRELPTERRDEIGSLAQVFNTMSARIETLSAKTQTLALEISDLSAFGATLAQTPDPHAELQRLADMIRAMFDAASAGVFLVYEGHTTRAAFSGSECCPVPSPASDELAAWAIRERDCLEAQDAENRRAPERARASHEPAAQLPRRAARAPRRRCRRAHRRLSRRA